MRTPSNRGILPWLCANGDVQFTVRATGGPGTHINRPVPDDIQGEGCAAEGVLGAAVDVCGGPSWEDDASHTTVLRDRRVGRSQAVWEPLGEARVGSLVSLLAGELW